MGDEPKKAAAGIQRSIRAVDVAARLGGDEFAILLPDTDETMAEAFIRRLRDNLGAPTRRSVPETTFSIGVVTFLTPPEHVAELLRATDVAMYHVKRTGKSATRHEVVPISLPRTGST